MKKHLWIVAFMVVSLAAELKAQPVKSFSPSAFMEPFRLEVGYNKTTHLVFPFSIIGIDRGSASILAQMASGVDNILKVKADQKGFAETSLSVITSDGKLYSFLVCYNENPAFLNVALYSAAGRLSADAWRQKGKGDWNEALLAYYAKLSLGAARNSYSVRTRNGKASLHLEGIYVKESVLFFRLQLQNVSAINFDMDGFRLFLRDRKQSKRTAIQEKEVEPLYIEGDATTIQANSTQTTVLAVPAFTVPKDKYLVIEITERGGGRNLFLKIKGRHLLKARPLD